MRRYLIPISVLLGLVLGLLVSCSGTANINETTERDKAVTFVKGAYPIAEELRAVADDWNAFLYEMGNIASDDEVVDMCRQCQSRLEALQSDLSELYALPSLVELKDDMALCISTGIEAFGLGQECAITHSFDCCRQADEKLGEFYRLIRLVEDEYDDGLAHYDIKPSEILP